MFMNKTIKEQCSGTQKPAPKKQLELSDFFSPKNEIILFIIQNLCANIFLLGTLNIFEELLCSSWQTVHSDKDKK